MIHFILLTNIGQKSTPGQEAASGCWTVFDGLGQVLIHGLADLNQASTFSLLGTEPKCMTLPSTTTLGVDMTP